MKSLCKFYLYKLFTAPFSYLIGLLFVLCVVVNIFVLQDFFSVSSFSLNRFFSVIPYICIIIVPSFYSLLPFSSKDYNLPFKDIENVLARLFSVFLFFSMFVLLTFIVPFSISRICNLDKSELILGYIGIFLYLVSSFSICQFFFYLIPYIGISFVFSSFVLACFVFCHKVNFLSYLSFYHHFSSFSKGIIDTRDLLYYLCISLFSITLCVLVVQVRRGNTSKRFKKCIFLSLCLLFFLLIDSTRFYKRIDFSKGKLYSVSSFSKSILDDIDSPLMIRYYRSSCLKYMHPDTNDVDEYLRLFSLSNKKIHYSIVDPVKQKLESSIESYGIRGQQIQTQNSDTVSYTTVYSGIIVEYKGQTRTIPFILNNSVLEYDLIRNINFLVRNRFNACQILVGNGLFLEEDYSYLIPWLENQGFYAVESFLPSSLRGTDDIFTLRPSLPLIILGTSRFTQDDIIALDYFIERGGKVFIALTPYNVDVSDWSIRDDSNFYIVSDWLLKYGINFKDSIIADSSCFNLILASQDSSNKKHSIKYSLWPELKRQKYINNGITLFWPCALEIDSEYSSSVGYKAEGILYTSENAWQEKKIDGNYITNPFNIKEKPDSSDIVEKFFLGATVSKKNKDNPSLFILGDQYAFLTSLLSFSSDFRAFEFLTDSLLYMNGESEILKLKNRESVDKFKFDIDENIVIKVRKLVFFCFFVPCVFVVSMCLCMIIIRKKVFIYEKN